MENKSITNTAKVLLCIWNIGLFSLVWFFCYNKYAFDSYLLRGGIISCLVFSMIYLSLCNVYQGFRIASTYIADTLFSQTIAFGIADLVLYIECCLIYNQYTNIFPGLCTVLFQILGSAAIIAVAKRHMVAHINPKKTLLVYGGKATDQEAMDFKKRLLEKYHHLFDISRIEHEKMEAIHFDALIRQYEAVILYEISKKRRSRFIKLCTEQKKIFYFTPRIEDILCQGAVTKNFLDTPLLKYGYRYESAGGYTGKRLMDIALSLFCLLLFSPLLLITAVCIKLEDHGPVFFKQKRCTKDGKVFEILKFRSMIVDAEKNGAMPCKKNDERITKVGKIIRATRIDELPQLINILRNDMSFVGPRPERVEHAEQYTKEIPEFAYRLRVKGGLTGYAQIFGKYNTTAYDKLRMDLMYIENQSLVLDLKILMLTFKTIFKAESTEGFSEEKSEEMKEKAKMGADTG